MTNTKHGLIVGALVAACLFLGNAATAEDDGGKGKGKGAKPEVKSTTIQIDLSKLPPDLAKQLLKYAEAPKGKPAEAPKGKPAEAPKGKPAAPAAKAPQQLPPGLANKAKDHPGRVAWLKAHAPGKQAAPATPDKKKAPPGKGKKKDKDDDDDSDNEQDA
jgi:hypothetical protein